MSLFRVGEMHKKFGFIPADKPRFLREDTMCMRLNFLLEELMETADACGFELVDPLSVLNNEVRPYFAPAKYATRDLGKAFDGLLDLEVVLHGTAHLMGFNAHVPANVKSRYGTIWSEGQDRVFIANMQKERCKPDEVGKRGTSFDLIKPKGWKAPVFEDLLQ